MTLDYFYGQSGELFSYFRIPKALFQDRRFRQLSTDARTLYGILLDRMSLSAKNGWLDEQGRVYMSGKCRNPSAAPSTRRSSCSGNWRTPTLSSVNAVVWADPASSTSRTFRLDCQKRKYRIAQTAIQVLPKAQLWNSQNRKQIRLIRIKQR